jgi:hypothetical protein
MNLREVDTLRALNTMVGRSTPARTLNLIDAIDETISSVGQDAAEMRFNTQNIRLEIAKLPTVPQIIDEDGTLVEMFEQTREKLGFVHTCLKQKLLAAKHDARLCDEDCVVDAYNEIIEACADLHNAVNDLCWAINEHDADLSEVLPGSFTSADALMAAMGV